MLVERTAPVLMLLQMYVAVGNLRYSKDWLVRQVQLDLMQLSLGIKNFQLPHSLLSWLLHNVGDSATCSTRGADASSPGGLDGGGLLWLGYSTTG